MSELVFVPLGGVGEIGMNLGLYGLGEGPDDYRWLMVDCGITFSNGIPPGIDVILPDPKFIEERRDRLEGILLTHAHEDHMGAVPYLWDRFRVPVFGTPFALSVLSRKLKFDGPKQTVPLKPIPLNGKFKIGPFDLETVQFTHSIPEPSAILIHSPHGTVLHTGDWKLDPDPVVGGPVPDRTLAYLGKKKILALVSDSTNVFVSGHSGSEADLLGALTDVVSGCRERVAVTCFATNVARLKTLSRVAMATERDVVLIGRSLWRIQEAARENGYLDDVPAFLSEDDAGYLPRDKALYIVTGSQGEARSALARMALDDHPRIRLEPDDTVIFSSRTIPGNEGAVARVHNNLVRRGIRVVTAKEKPVHVSGHPSRDEMRTLYQYVKPRIAVPVHGETRHLAEHADLARAMGVEYALVGEDGAMIRLAPGIPEIVGHVPVGRLALDGNRIVPLDGELVKSRQRALWNGSVVITVVVDREGYLMAKPKISTSGLLDIHEHWVQDGAAEAVHDALDDLSARSLRDDDALAEAVRVAVRRYFRDSLDKKPVTHVHLVRID
ncbi:MAG: ribonuclease J [Magnetospirillum sp. WYHS-4]